MTDLPGKAEFLAELVASSSRDQVEKVRRYFQGGDQAPDNQILGVSIGTIFPIAKRFAHLSLDDVETLLESPYYEVRMGAVAVLDFQARAKATTAEGRKALFDLYLRRHDRINNWDLVDRAAPHVVGEYLKNRPRDVLHELARSANPWERRTALVATHAFLKRGEVDDTFQIAEILVDDEHPYVQKAIGSWVREAGKRDPSRLVAFLEAHRERLPRATVRSASEKLPPGIRAAIV